MAKATLTIASKNYGSWSLRGWLLCKTGRTRFRGRSRSQRRSFDARRIVAAVAVVSWSPASRITASRSGTRWRSPNISTRSCRKPGLLPKTLAARARCRSICGEMHSGFSNLRSALPMNLKAHHPGFKVWAGAQADIEPHRQYLARMPRNRQRPVPFRRKRPAWRTPCSRRL